MKKVYITLSLEEMMIFINSVFYSLYCFDRWIYRLLDSIFKPLRISMCKLMYILNPFGIIKKRYKKLDEYIKYIHESENDIYNDLDYGINIMRGQGFLVSSFVPYLMLIISLLIKYFKPDLFSEDPFKTVLIITFCISSLINYLAAFRNDKFKLYFKKFNKEKSHLKWHLISAIFYAGAIYIFLFSLQLW
jgi:hypothetical protein